MKISECMTRMVRIVDPDDTLRDAAQLMSDIDAGILPVAEGDRLIGIITDRDIAIRAVGAGRPPDACIRDVMSREVRYCFDDADTAEVLQNMAELQIRRLPVVDRDKQLVGIVSISDLAGRGNVRLAGEALSEITRPSDLHSQAL